MRTYFEHFQAVNDAADKVIRRVGILPLSVHGWNSRSNYQRVETMFDYPPARLVGILCLFSILLSFGAANAQSAKLRLVTNIGDWSLFCANEADKPKMSDCALAGGTVSEQDPGLWVRLGLAFDSEGTNAKMIIRIPLTNYTNLKKGIFLSTDTEKIGRVFIDDCDKVEGVCRASVGIVARNFNAILSASTLNVQFQSERDKGVSLTVAMGGFLPVFDELQKVVGMKKRTADGDLIASLSNALTYSLTLASAGLPAEKQPATTDPTSRFLRIVRDCPAESLVIKADQVQPSRAISKWSAAAGKCTDVSLVMIVPDYGQPDAKDFNQPPDVRYEPNVYDIANMYKLARLVSANVPNQRLDLVYRDRDGTPVQIGANR